MTSTLLYLNIVSSAVTWSGVDRPPSNMAVWGPTAGSRIRMARSAMHRGGEGRGDGGGEEGGEKKQKKKRNVAQAPSLQQMFILSCSHTRGRHPS